MEVGQCVKCGREVEFCYPKPLTQLEKNQLATLLCPTVHAAKCNGYGVCKYCGQVILIDKSEIEDKETCDRMATDRCDCPEAKQESIIGRQVESAKRRIRELFGDLAPNNDFEPIENDEVINHLHMIAEQIIRGNIRSAVVKIDKCCKAKIALDAKGNVNVERNETKEIKLKS